MKIDPASAGDLDGIQALLQLESLPSSDITVESVAHFLVCREAHNVVGAVGVEIYGQVGLLRSLVVAHELRGCGLGHRLANAAERQANELGVHALYLLTTTAAKFFETLGYRRIDRAQSALEIQRTTQFATLCPASATVMVKS